MMTNVVRETELTVTNAAQPCTVATSPVVLRSLCDSPRTGCAWRTKIYLCGGNKQ